MVGVFDRKDPNRAKDVMMLTDTVFPIYTPGQTKTDAFTKLVAY
jgi:hypothetical protein